MTYENRRFSGTKARPDTWQRGGTGGLDPLPAWPDDPLDSESGPPTGRRRSGGRLVNLLTGAIVGVLGGGIAIGVATLAAAFVRPQASPIIAVGEAAIDRTPPAVKNFAVQYFGSNDKTMLLLGIYTVIALIAMTLGCLARRWLTAGLIGLALFGAFGAFVALTRPESRTTDAIPSLVGGLAGLAALPMIVWAARPGAAATRADMRYERPDTPYERAGTPYERAGTPYERAGTPYEQPNIRYGQPNMRYEGETL